MVGTHALFQERCRVPRFGLAVIDEQHRFGVAAAPGAAAPRAATPTLLVMSATPIPRTLMLTRYGDLDISRLDKKPPGGSRSIPAPFHSSDGGGDRRTIARALARRQGVLGLPDGRGVGERRYRRRRGTLHRASRTLRRSRRPRAWLGRQPLRRPVRGRSRPGLELRPLRVPRPGPQDRDAVPQAGRPARTA